MIALGYNPLPLKVTLSADADFVASLINTVEPWPGGTAISLRFYVEGAPLFTPIEWPATIDGDTASWVIDKVTTAAVVNSRAFKVELVYNDMLWAKGKVYVP